MLIYTFMRIIDLLKSIIAIISAVKYFFRSNHGPNLNNCSYFKTQCQNFAKTYVLTAKCDYSLGEYCYVLPPAVVLGNDIFGT